MRSLLFASCLILFSSSLPTRAQGGPDSPSRQEAREAFEAHDYSRALTLLRRLHERSPSPRVLFNIATCYARLARHREASQTLETLLAQPDLASTFSDAERETAEADLQEARSRLATLRIEGPAGDIVTIDETMECALPCDIDVDAGRRRVRWSGDGTTRTIEAVRGATSRVRFEAEATVPPPPQSQRFAPDVLTWLGVGVALVGGAGVVGFGLFSNDLLDRFNALGAGASESLADEGRLVTGLANASIGVAVLGGGLILIDLLIERAVH